LKPKTVTAPTLPYSQPTNRSTHQTSIFQIDAPTAVSVSDPNAKEFQRLHEIVKKGASAFIEVGQALNAIHEDMLWKAGGYKTWESYCKSVVGLSKSHAHRLMDASEVALHLGKQSPRGDAGSEVIARRLSSRSGGYCC